MKITFHSILFIAIVGQMVVQRHSIQFCGR